MARDYNFGAGPATLPREVLEQAQADLVDWQGRGVSVMEMSHRSAAFAAIAAHAEARLRALLTVPDDYSVLFLQGGAAGQFAAVAMNLMGENARADYLITGNWGKKALAEAQKYGDARVAASAETDGFTGVPPRARWRLRADAAYLHYTPNETIQGVAFGQPPDAGDVPLVADLSSAFLAEPIDVRRYGVIYAGAQKNAGPAGLTIVIVRNDLLERARPDTPMVLDYARQAAAGSMLNTPPCFAWYVCGLVLDWIDNQGGLAALAEYNRAKANALYAFIDDSGFYRNPVEPGARSRMNVPFLLADERQNHAFVAEAEAAGLRELKGHRAVGGMRASLYNAMPKAGVDALIAFMRDFEARHG